LLANPRNASAKRATALQQWSIAIGHASGKRMSDTPSATDPVPDSVLAGFRASIDNIDAALIHILAERFRITKAVGAYQAERNLPASDPSREERQITRLRALAQEANLDPDFGEKFLRFIIDEVIRHHEQAQTRS
jgi:chorismate mutase